MGILPSSAKRRAGNRRRLLRIHEDGTTLAAEEKRFRDAENQRLLYVAATRAGAMLTITQRGKGNNWNPWQFFEEHLGDSPSLEDPGERVAKPTKPLTITSRRCT